MLDFRRFGLSAPFPMPGVSATAFFRGLAFAVFMLCGVLEGPAADAEGSADWPMVRHDAAGSARTVHALPGKLVLRWVHTPRLPPAPAWPAPAERNISAKSEPLVQSHIYDRAFRVVGGGDRVYYGSSSDDALVCLDGATGRVLWEHSTEGPVRLAPTLHGGKLYVGSDDGTMSCLDAESGRLVWRTRGAPGDRRLSGNGRLISRWPVRAGTIVEDGVVYFTAGIFPSEGVYVCAVRASDGSLLWRTPAPVAPQGYMLASAERLYVPAGRTPFHQIDRASGKTIRKYGRSNSWGLDLVGGSFAVLVGDRLTTGPSEDGQIHLFNVGESNPLFRVPGRQLIVGDPLSYVLQPTGIKALETSGFFETTPPPEGKKKKGVPRKLLLPRWHHDFGGAVNMIMAGGTVYVGGKGEVVAVDGESGNRLWQAPIEGRVGGMAACDGRLLVSSEGGKIYCFCGEEEAKGEMVATAIDNPAEATRPRVSPSVERLRILLAERGPLGKGFALVLGLDAEAVDLMRLLVAHTGLRVVGVDRDRLRVDEVRRLLRVEGLYGSRAVLHVLDPAELPYTDKFANLVVVTPGGGDPGAVRREAERLVRPYRGLLVWEEEIDGGGRAWVRHERGAPEGAGEWTHFYADAGNSACSDDETPSGPMELQWFGQPGPRQMIDRHWKTVAPLCKNGRLFVTGDNYLAALDAFNGTLLWDKDVPDSVRTIGFKNCSNMAVGEDALYVAAGRFCKLLDPVSGEERGRCEVPPSLADEDHEWGYLALADGLLVGSVTRPGASFRQQGKWMSPLIWGNKQPLVTSRALFARAAGEAEPAWTFSPETGVIINSSLAISEGHVFFVEGGKADAQQDEDGRLTLADLLEPGAFLVSLDVRTGKVRWRKPVDLTCMHHILYLSAASGKILVSGTQYVDKRIRYELKTYRMEDGGLLWENHQKPDYDDVLGGGHGEQIQHLAIRGDTIFGPGFACAFSTGEKHDGWVWHKGNKCTTVSLSARSAYSRFNRAKNPYQFDLVTGKPERLTSITRPGCYINIIPAAGMVLIPDQSSGCTCEYPIQTSLALTPVTEAHPKPDGLVQPAP